jgi:orotidine-5'-phosphate decarboxylase
VVKLKRIIIVALDRMSPDKALELAEILKREVWGFKANVF